MQSYRSIRSQWPWKDVKLYSGFLLFFVFFFQTTYPCQPKEQCDLHVEVCLGSFGQRRGWGGTGGVVWKNQSPKRDRHTTFISWIFVVKDLFPSLLSVSFLPLRSLLVWGHCGSSLQSKTETEMLRASSAVSHEAARGCPPVGLWWLWLWPTPQAPVRSWPLFSTVRPRKQLSSSLNPGIWAGISLKPGLVLPCCSTCLTWR